MKAFGALGDLTELPSSAYHVMTQQGVWSLRSRREPIAEPDHAAPDPELPASQNVSNKHLSCVNHPVCGFCYSRLNRLRKHANMRKKPHLRVSVPH